MSRCYYLICDDCKVYLWSGQDHWTYGRKREGDYQSPTDAFLYKHQHWMGNGNHNLRFTGDDNVLIEIDDYTEVKWDDDALEFTSGEPILSTNPTERKEYDPPQEGE